MPSCASRCRAPTTAPAEEAGRRRRRVAATQSGIPADDRRTTTPDTIRARRSCRPRRRRCSSTPSRKPASPAASTGTATCRATGSALPSIDHTVARAVADDHGGERRRCCRRPSADGMEKLIPDLEKYLVRGSGHWTQQEKPEEVSAKLIEWRRRRFGRACIACERSEAIHRPLRKRDCSSQRLAMTVSVDGRETTSDNGVRQQTEPDPAVRRPSRWSATCCRWISTAPVQNLVRLARNWGRSSGST